jgi:hypothetical protein
MAWSLDEDLQQEGERRGLSLFDCVYTVFTNSLYVSQRQHKLFFPLIWQQLLRVHMLTALVRPGGVPTSNEVGDILLYSWTLYRLETDVSRKSSLVTTALEAVERYKAVSPAGTVLAPPYELSWFQLRHAEAELSHWNNSIYNAKELYDRNLADLSQEIWSTSCLKCGLRTRR